jgi:hypothetical protein
MQLTIMLHRHLNHQDFTLAAIDDVISRGRWQDWATLRRAALQDISLLEKVQRICRPYLGDERVARTLQTFDALYSQDNGESPLQQL